VEQKVAGENQVLEKYLLLYHSAINTKHIYYPWIECVPPQEAGGNNCLCSGLAK